MSTNVFGHSDWNEPRQIERLQRSRGRKSRRSGRRLMKIHELGNGRCLWKSRWELKAVQSIWAELGPLTAPVDSTHGGIEERCTFLGYMTNRDDVNNLTPSTEHQEYSRIRARYCIIEYRTQCLHLASVGTSVRVQSVERKHAQSWRQWLLASYCPWNGRSSKDDWGKESKLDTIWLLVLYSKSSKTVLDPLVKLPYRKYRYLHTKRPTVQPATIEGTDPVRT